MAERPKPHFEHSESILGALSYAARLRSIENGTLDPATLGLDAFSVPNLTTQGAQRSLDALSQPEQHYLMGHGLAVLAEAPGVAIQFPAFKAGSDLDQVRSRANRPLRSGRHIGGYISQISAAPEHGGYVRLRKGPLYAHIFGLVDPQTGEPQVHLTLYPLIGPQRTQMVAHKTAQKHAQ